MKNEVTIKERLVILHSSKRSTYAVTSKGWLLLEGQSLIETLRYS